MDPADRAACLAADVQLRLLAVTEFTWRSATPGPPGTWVVAAVGSSGVRLIPASSVGRRPAAPRASGAPGRSDASVLGAS